MLVSTILQLKKYYAYTDYIHLRFNAPISNNYSNDLKPKLWLIILYVYILYQQSKEFESLGAKGNFQKNFISSTAVEIQNHQSILSLFLSSKLSKFFKFPSNFIKL